jgi:hypothetical protein
MVAVSKVRRTFTESLPITQEQWFASPSHSVTLSKTPGQTVLCDDVELARELIDAG